MSNTTVKKIPTRRCSGCGEHFPKNTLIRVLRTPEGEIILDLTGKKNGRGAYICRDRGCLSKAIKAKRFERAFGCAVEQHVYDNLLAQFDEQN